MNEKSKEEERNNRKVDRYIAAVSGLRADNPGIVFDIDRLHALWGRDLALSKSACDTQILKESHAKKFAAPKRRLAELEPPRASSRDACTKTVPQLGPKSLI